MAYEIRRSGVVYATGPERNLGYSPETLRAMAGAGYHLYIDGKKSRPGMAVPKAASKNQYTSILEEK